MEMKKAPISVSASNPMMTPTNSVARTEEASTPRGVVGEVLSSSNALPAAEGSSAEMIYDWGGENEKRQKE